MKPTMARMLIGVALANKDAVLLRRAAELARVADTRLVTLLHVLPSFYQMMTESFRRELADSTRERLNDLAAQWRSKFPSNVELRPVVHFGNPGLVILQTALSEIPDLICLGRASKDKSHLGEEARTVARQAPCSVLLVAGDDSGKWGRIWVPLDFSDRSFDALEVSAMFAAAHQNARVTVQHVYGVPVGYDQLGRTFDEFANEQKLIALAEWQKLEKEHSIDAAQFQLRLDLDPTPMVFDSHHYPIVEAGIQEGKPDLVVLSSRGRGAVTAFLLGSMAARLVEKTDRTILVLRRPGDNLGLLEALFLP